MTTATYARRSVSFVLVGLAIAAPAGGVTTEEFRLRSGNDLVALCSTATDDPLYVAAIHMCHGFGAGTYQTIQAMTQHEKLEPLFCPPQPPIARNDAVRMFLDWAKSNSDHMVEPPAQFVGRFLVEKFPCEPK